MLRDDLSDCNYERWSDEELAESGHAGSSEARNALFMRHRDLMKKLAYPAKRLLYIVTASGRAGSAIDAEDVDQQAFIIFCALLNAWDPTRAPFMHYFPRLIHWRLLGYVRDHIDRKRKGDDLPSIIPLEVSYEQVEAQAADSPEGQSRFEWEQRLRGLPEPLRDTVSLRFYYDLSTAQIATARGRARRTVNRNIQTAISMLREAIEDQREGCL